MVMDKGVARFAFFCAYLGAVPFAFAQVDAATDSDTSVMTVRPPDPPPITREILESRDAPPPPPPEQKKLDVGFTWALQVGVPIFLDVDRDTVKAGGDVSFFGGADFDYFIIGGAGGIGWNPIKLDNVEVQGVTLSGRSPLTRVFLSIPEFRVQVPKLEVMLPYVGASFDMNFWNFRQTEVECGFYYCNDVSIYKFTPGFTVRGGVGFDVKNHIYVDVGLRYSYSGKGNFFERKQQWLTPYVGVLVRAR